MESSSSTTHAMHTSATDAWKKARTAATPKLTASTTPIPIMFFRVIVWSSGIIIPLLKRKRKRKKKRCWEKLVEKYSGMLIRDM
jgi:hypothetical protein